MKHSQSLRHATVGTLFSSLIAASIAGAGTNQVDLAKDRVLYVVGYAHLDTEWRWTYPYTIQYFVRNTMEQNFPLLEKYPDYLFNFTGSRRYEFMKEYYPADYAKVKEYVAEGRWYPGGASVDENDANIPSLESFVRQTLYGNLFFKREFGITSDDYMLPDCFGFPASLPTVFSHEGLKGFSTQKLTWGSAVGIPFNIGNWIGPDGSFVMAALNPGSYTGTVDEDLSQSKMWLKRIEDTGAKSGIYADYHYYGTGDRGGAPDDKSVDWIARSVKGDGPVRVLSARSDEMFNDIDPKAAAHLPSYKGDLLLVNHSAGSLSSQAYMKRWNRQNEQLANAAESAASAAVWLGALPYPHDALYEAWNLVLGSQMHDIMPGTSLPQAYEYAWNDEVLALNQFAGVLTHSSAAVLSTLDTQVQGVPVGVYNALPIARQDPVEATISYAATVPESVTAYGPQGQAVPTQILERGAHSLRVLFIADVPSVGYAVYDVRPGGNPDAQSGLKITENSLENARYKVDIDQNGDIRSIYDKSLRRELLAAPMQLEIHPENPELYPAWNMDWDDRQKPVRTYVQGPAKIRIVESGPARVTLEVEREAENGIYKQQIRLAAGSAGDRLEVLNCIDWRSLEASLRASFHLTASNRSAAFDDKVGVVMRDNNTPKLFEMPLQQWMDLTDASGGYGVEVMSDSKYASDKPDDSTLRLTLLYTPGTRGGYRDQATQDHGRHEILYALAAHKGGWAEGRNPWQAARLNQPLHSFLPAQHSGNGRTFSFLTLNTDQVQVAAVKKAEESDDIIVRLKELTGQPAENVALHFAAAIAAAHEVDGQERPIGEATLKNGQLAFNMKPFSLRAFALRLAPPSSPVEGVTSKPVPLIYNADVVSSRSKRDDGAMDAAGNNYPAELFPNQLTRHGVQFALGPTADGQKNALTAQGQTIELPGGAFNRVHLLVAADGDTTSRIRIGDTDHACVVPNWTGYIGQWDNRLWDSPIPELSYDTSQQTVGLVPGYIKRTPVAWFATHHNTLKEDAYYRFSYLFQLSYELPAGVHSLTLPSDSKLRVFAVSVANEPSSAVPAAPLYDTLSERQPGGSPIISQAGQTFNKATAIALVPPLYHRPGELHYTLDGSNPTANSPVYDCTQPFVAEDTVNLAVAQIDGSGKVGPIVRGVVTVHDHEPPQWIKVLARDNSNAIELTFSKPVDPAAATDAKNYSIQPALPIGQITQSADRRKVEITFASAIPVGIDYTVNVSGIKDQTPYKNVILPASKVFNAQNVAYSLKAAALPEQSFTKQVAGLPLKQDDAWTMNILVKPSQQPDSRTTIAGFGANKDNSAGGTSRYFAVFDDGIRFWSANRDVTTDSPLVINQWQMLTATYDGKTLNLYKDGYAIGQRDIELSDERDADVNIGKPDPWDHRRIFRGEVRDFSIRREALSRDQIKELYKKLKPE